VGLVGWWDGGMVEEGRREKRRKQLNSKED